MTMNECPQCGCVVDAARDCHGVVAVRPCMHWLTPEQVHTAGLDALVAPAPKAPRR